MNFDEAEKRRIQLSADLKVQKISAEQFAAALNDLRITDPSGKIWQPDPASAGWIYWNGSAWLPGTPPVPGTGSYYIPPAVSKTPVTATVSSPQRTRDFNEFKSSLMTVEEFKKVSKETPLAKRPQKWWDLLSIMGGVIAAVLWFVYGGIRSGREGFDLLTPLLMIAIPVLLVWFRQDIDQMLLPLQPHRKKISRIILIGLGMATPFLTAWILYNLFGISQYPLMQANIVVGTLAAYVVTRDPQITPGQKGTPGAGLPAAMIIFSALLVSLIITPVMADDCMSDPLNAQDCLRTDGYAEVMAGLVSTILAILVNGPIILQTLLQGGGGVQPPVPTGPPAPPQLPAQSQPPSAPPSQPQTPPPPPPEPPKTTDEERRQIEEALAAMKKQKADMLAAAAAAKEKAAAAAAAAQAHAQGIDLLTGKKILTPEQLKRKAEILAEMALNQAESQRWTAYSNTLDTAVTVLTAVEKSADIAIDIGSTLSPGAGGRIKNIYAVTKTVSKNMSQSFAEGKGLMEGFKGGVVEAATDKALDLFAGQVTDKFKGKIPGFGKFDTHSNDLGDLSLGQIRDRLSKSAVPDSGDIVQDLRNIMKNSDAQRALSNSLKNATQGQVQGTVLWDPFKKGIGVTK